MKIESNNNNKFTIDFSSYEKIGFHGTSSLAENKIETHGFLPDKIFSPQDHEKILHVANKLEIDISWYQCWLEMRSVTFAKNEVDALNHIKSGSSGGQGLGNLQEVLEGISDIGKSEDRKMAGKFISHIQNIRNSTSVIYAVNLSGLGPRLVHDSRQLLYQIYFDPNTGVPKTSIVTKEAIIAKLQLKKHA